MPEGRPAEGQEAVHTDQDPLLTGEAHFLSQCLHVCGRVFEEPIWVAGILVVIS